MERWTITIDTDNAAFENSPTGEIACILRELADRFEYDGIPPEKLYDVNGNVVGSVKFEK